MAKGLRSQSRYCCAGTDKVASRAVSTLKGRVLSAFVVSFASAMRQLECKSGVSPSIPHNSRHGRYVHVRHRIGQDFDLCRQRLYCPLAGLSGRSQSFEVNRAPRLASSPVGLSNRKVSFVTPKLRFLPDKLARGAIGLIATCANFKTFVPVGQADWRRDKVWEQKRLVEKSCQHPIFDTPALAPLLCRFFQSSKYSFETQASSPPAIYSASSRYRNRFLSESRNHHPSILALARHLH